MDTKEKKMQNKENWNACKDILFDRGGVENLSRRSQPQWIENLSRIYRPDRKFLMDREAVEKLSRQSPKSSMDRDCINFDR